MKKLYIKPTIVFVDLITEGDFCCACSPGCYCEDCDCEDDEAIEPGNGDAETGIPAGAYAYRYPIWND